MPEQFQEKCETVFRPELRENKKIERICDSRKSRSALALLPDSGLPPQVGYVPKRLPRIATFIVPRALVTRYKIKIRNDETEPS
jgi:hypothetical protein